MLRNWKQTVGWDLTSAERGAWLRWLLAAFSFWLLVATRPLWLNCGEFPQVPLFAWGCVVPRLVDLCLLVVMAGSTIAIVSTNSASRSNRACLWMFAITLTGLLLLDQHRSQPWAYQFVLVAVVLAAAPHPLAISLLRVLTISIYLHSALSKIDYSFCTGLGHRLLLEFSSQFCGPSPAGDQPGPTGAWPLLFPIGELLVAVGLIWPVSRRCAMWCAAGMHLLLLILLGPWGLGHSAGVLIWNGYFIAQNFILFGCTPNTVNRPTTDPVLIQRTIPSQWVAVLLIGWSVLWPSLEPWGYCDLWPAWGLYAQHGEQLTVWITDRGKQRLPAIWQESATRKLNVSNRPGDWSLHPQQVSLKSVAAPLYPQNRFQLGVILNLFTGAGIEPEDVSAIWYFPANRWTGARRSIQLTSLPELQKMADRCWLNARSRD